MNVSAGLILGCTFLGAVAAASASAAAERTASSDPAEAKTSAAAELSESPRFLHDERQVSQGSVTLGGRTVGYQAEAGVMVVRLKDPMDEDPPLPREDRREFEKTLLGSETTTGRLDTRFSGPTLDPMSKEAEYDPQSAAISSAYVSAFNDYVRNSLKFGDKLTYKPEIDIEKNWDYLHQPPGATQKIPGPTNVMPDLAVAMKQNPKLKVQLNGGYYDLATPYFAAIFELHQLPLEASLQDNIEMHFYTSGHMVYAHEPDLKALHANVAAFIERTKNSTAGR